MRLLLLAVLLLAADPCLGTGPLMVGAPQPPRTNPRSVNLQQTLYSTAYRSRLSQAMAALMEYAVGHSWPPLSDLETHPRRMTNLLIEYAQYLFEDDGTINDATNAILSVQKRIPSLKGKLSAA